MKHLLVFLSALGLIASAFAFDRDELNRNAQQQRAARSTQQQRAAATKTAQKRKKRYLHTTIHKQQKNAKNSVKTRYNAKHEKTTTRKKQAKTRWIFL